MRVFYNVFLFCLLVLPSLVSAEKMQVGVSIAPQKYLVERIGGEHVVVSVMLKPGDSPEHFDPSPGQIALLNKASLYFPVGLEFERGWLQGFIEQNSNTRVVDCCSGVFASNREGLDTHAWISVRNAGRLAKLIHDELLAIDADNAAHYAENYEQLSRDLAMLDEEITASLEQRRTDYFIVSHAAFGHFAADYGLKQLALEEGGIEVGAKSLIRLARKARSEKITTLFTQQQHPSTSALALAREINARLVEIDPLPLDYISGMREIARQVAIATR